MIAVIMAGGSGTRFWPASREAMPKQFLRITGERSMLEETIARLRPVVDERNVYVVVGAVHAEITASLLGDSPARVVVEPVARNTAPCVGLAALFAKRHGEDVPMAVLPADHFVADPDEFAATLEAAGELAGSGAIVTLGIPPSRPETGYGYIEVGEEAGAASGRVARRVARFVEKPDAETALRYLTGGRHRWNSGIFVFTPRTILAAIDECLPDLGAGLREIDAEIGSPAEGDAIARLYAKIEPISIDYGVMERTSAEILMLDADFGWSDVGSWAALHELRAPEADEHGNLLIGDAVTIDAAGNLVYSEGGRLVALLGVERLVVADTGDVVMVADMSRSQEVKRFVELLRKAGRERVC